jgi:hypothetical protein
VHDSDLDSDESEVPQVSEVLVRFGRRIKSLSRLISSKRCKKKFGWSGRILTRSSWIGGSAG